MLHRLLSRPWLALALTLLACLPPLLIDLGTRDVTHTMENVALSVSQETWLRWHAGEPRAWAITFNDGVPRVEKPPMTAWLNALAWSDLDPQTAAPTDLVFRSRVISVALGLLLLASIFWLGVSLHGDVRFAVVATLAIGSTFFFQRQARTASYDIHFVSWLALAIAAAMWALQVRCEFVSRWRSCIGIAVSGVSLAIAVLSKGLLPAGIFAVVMLCTVGAMRGQPRRRLFAAAAIFASLAITSLAAGWWYIVAFELVPSAGSRLWRETLQPRDNPQPWYYYIGLLGLLVPWTIWLIGGLVQPFTQEWRTHRRTLIMPWLWFIAILIVMSIPPAKQQRYILPILPAAGLLIAHAWRKRATTAETDKPSTSLLDRLARDAHWTSLGIATLAACAVFAWPETFGVTLHTSLPMLVSVMLTAGLMAVVIWGWRWHRRLCVHKAAAATAAWMLAVMSVWWHLYAATPSEVRQFRLEAERLAALVGDASVHRLHLTGERAVDYRLNMEFRLYFGRLIDRVRVDTLNADARPELVLALDSEPYAHAMTAADYREVDVFATNKNERHRLWQRGVDALK